VFFNNFNLACTIFIMTLVRLFYALIDFFPIF
jgi:hypothetical protein